MPAGLQPACVRPVLGAAFTWKQGPQPEEAGGGGGVIARYPGHLPGSVGTVLL